MTISEEKPALTKAIEALDQAGKTFRRYEQIHAAKPDMVKAQANADMAVICERALGGLWLELQNGYTCIHGEGCQCI